MVALALKENASSNQETIDGKVDDQSNCCVRCKQDRCHDETEHAISYEYPSKQLCLPLRLDNHRSAVCHDFAHHITDF